MLPQCWNCSYRNISISLSNLDSQQGTLILENLRVSFSISTLNFSKNTLILILNSQKLPEKSHSQSRLSRIFPWALILDLDSQSSYSRRSMVWLLILARRGPLFNLCRARHTHQSMFPNYSYPKLTSNTWFYKFPSANGNQKAVVVIVCLIVTTGY